MQPGNVSWEQPSLYCPLCLSYDGPRYTRRSNSHGLCDARFSMTPCESVENAKPVVIYLNQAACEAKLNDKRTALSLNSLAHHSFPF